MVVVDMDAELTESAARLALRAKFSLSLRAAPRRSVWVVTLSKKGD